jgi:superfamily I DNA/RNA helicase
MNMYLCSELLSKHCLPHQVRKGSSSEFDPGQDSIKVLTLHASKGLKFPVVAMGRGPHAHYGRKRARGSAVVLCRCYAGDAAADRWY